MDCIPNSLPGLQHAVVAVSQKCRSGLMVKGHRPGPRGFTLIELMIVIAIIAVLGVIAMPFFTGNVQQSRRAEAQGALLELANFMERHNTMNGTYLAAGGGAPTLPFTTVPRTGNTLHYNLNFQTITANSYTLRAVPRNGSPQAGDACGTLTLTHAGRRGGAQASCWPD